MVVKGLYGIGCVVVLATACGSTSRAFKGATAGSAGAGDSTGVAGEGGSTGVAGEGSGAESNGGTAMAGSTAGGSETTGDPCSGDPCGNGGECSARDGRAVCSCRPGYDGERCELNIDDCASKPCQNGGGCTDGVEAYTCTCTSRYTGPECEYLEFKLVPSSFLNDYDVTATALSNDGKVLLFNFSDDSGRYGFGRLVDFEAATELSLSLPLNDGRAFGVDNDGTNIVGEAASDGLNRAFKRVGGASALIDLSGLAGTQDSSSALDVSADGTTIVGEIYGGGTIAFWCTSGQPCRRITIDVTNWIEQVATSVNADGTVVVGYSAPSDPLAPGGSGAAWRWVSSKAKADLLSLGAGTWTNPRPNAVSRNGQVVVGQVEINGISHAVQWSGASFTPTDLGVGRATGTSADGSVTVGVDNAGVPVVWTGTERQTLTSILGTNPDLNGLTLSTLVAISDDGKVVGGTAKVSGRDRAFMARLP